MGDTALKKKYDKIVNALGAQTTFYMDEVKAIFPEMKQSSLYWYMSKMVDAGYLKRVRNGVYTFNEWKGKKSVSLSKTAEKVRDILDESGFDYYISGLDILVKYMQHVPEQYPVMAFVEKKAKEEIADALKTNLIRTVEPTQVKKEYENNMYLGQKMDWVILYPTNKFEYEEDGLATTEKAFVDLYYAVTRNAYPVALQEVVRIYENLVRLGNIDKKKMIHVAASRSIQYDIRFIAESKFITDRALEFVEILRKEG